MSVERLIVQNIKRNELKESIGFTFPEPGSSEVRKISDLIETLSVMAEKGYNNYPDDTSEKIAYRSIENKLAELGVSFTKAKNVKSEGIPGEFEKESKRFKVK